MSHSIFVGHDFFFLIVQAKFCLFVGESNVLFLYLAVNKELYSRSATQNCKRIVELSRGHQMALLSTQNLTLFHLNPF